MIKEEGSEAVNESPRETSLLRSVRSVSAPSRGARSGSVIGKTLCIVLSVVEGRRRGLEKIDDRPTVANRTSYQLDGIQIRLDEIRALSTL